VRCPRDCRQRGEVTDHAAPLESLHALAVQDVEVMPGLRHLELYSMSGLLTVLWHGDPTAERVVVACGGATGSLLGPADGLYQDLGFELARQGIGVMRVGYRRPNDLAACVHDLAAASDLASRQGAQRIVAMGHSFGGAVAMRLAIAAPEVVVGVVTLATQSAGCEDADRLRCPLLLFHGDRDELLPPVTSEMVRMLAGRGELVVLPGAGHLLNEAAPALRDRLRTWLPQTLKGTAT
jgi:alpha-beta hydrolase superfamily lysophospholipase